MIKVTIYNNEQFGFSVEGHARFARHGSDIVCSAVTCLVFNTINSIEAFTNQKIVTDSADGYISCFFFRRYR